METVLLYVIVLLLVAICALAGFWFYRATQVRGQHAGPPQPAPEIAHHSARNRAWDRAVRSARNRNW
jgi:hypothetical protein